MSSRACVLGSLSLVRPLGRGGVPVVALVTEANRHLSLSRYVHEVIEAKDDPVGALVRYAESADEPPCLFYESDDDLLLASRNRARLAHGFRFTLPPAELVEALVDKRRFAALAQQLMLPTPRTCIIPAGSAPPAQWDAFPAIIKPSIRTHWFGARLRDHIIVTEKAVKVSSRAELELLCSTVASIPCDFILQELIEGGEEQVVSYHAYVRDGVVIADFTGRKVRTTPRAYGFSSCVEITDDDTVRHTGRDVLGRLGFNGVVKLDFKERREDGRLFLLEANPRFNLWHHPGAIAGVNLPLLVYRDLVKPGSVHAGSTRVKPGVRWMSAALDRRALREYRAAGELTVFAWLVDVARADVIEDLNWRDPLPGVARLWRRIHRKAA